MMKKLITHFEAGRQQDSIFMYFSVEKIKR